MDEGNLVPDEVVIGMIGFRFCRKTSRPPVLSSTVSRTVPQAEAFDRLPAAHQTKVCMVALEVKEDELVKRLLSAGKTSGRPDDQDEAKISSAARCTTPKRPRYGYYATQNKHPTP
jgi:adenylate kinase